MSRTSASYLTAYRSVTKFFSSLSHPLTHIRLDNEISSDLTAFFQASSPPIKYQCVPPFNHRANKAERSICTGKNHFLSVLSSAHITFPPNRWSDLLPVAELTLNQLRPSALDSSLSAWHGLHGLPVDFAAHPSILPVSSWWSTTHRSSASRGITTASGPFSSVPPSLTTAATLSSSLAPAPPASQTPLITSLILSFPLRMPPLTLSCRTLPLTVLTPLMMAAT
jgi:hypothetical protein